MSIARTRHAGIAYIALLGVSAALTWRLFVLPAPNYWDHVPPPYGWGTAPIGWTDELLGGIIWVNGTYWLLPFWLLSPGAVTKALLIVPAFLAPAAIFTFIGRLGVRPTAAAIGALYYFLNPSVHTRYLQGHTGDILGHAVVPLFALAVWSLLGAPRVRRYAAVVGLSFFAAGSLKPHWLALQILVILPYVLALFIADRARLISATSFARLWAGIGVGLLLSLPTIMITATVGMEVLERLHSPVHLQALSSRVFLAGAIRLAGESAVGWLPSLGYYRLDVRGLLGFLPGLFVLFSPLFTSGPHRRLAVVTVITAALTLVLALGTTYSSWPYLWLYEHVPLFAAFRESSKFLTVGSFISGVGLALALNGIMSRYGRRLASVVVGTVLAAMLVYAWPMLGGDLGITRGEIYRPTTGAVEVGRWLDSQPGAFRVMVIPHDDETFHVWPWVSRRPLFAVDNDRALTALASTYHAFRTAELGRVNQDRLFAEMLAMAGVRFVVLREQQGPSSFSFTSRAATIEPDVANATFNTSTHFRKVFIHEEYAVYENEAFRGWLWVERSVGTASPDADCSSGFRGAPVGAALAMHDLGEWVDPSEVDVTVGEKWIAGAAYEWVYPGPYAWGEVTQSRWYAVTKGKATLERVVDIPQAGQYKIYLRGLIEREAQLPIVLINGRGLIATEPPAPRRFNTIAYGPVSLTAGHHILRITGRGGLVAIDAIVFSPEAFAFGMTGVWPDPDGVAGRMEEVGPSLKYLRLLPGLYVFQLNGAPKTMLTLADAARPAWALFSRRVRAEIMQCRSPLLHIQVEGGSGTIIVWNPAALAVQAAWLASAIVFLIAILGVVFRVFPRTAVMPENEQLPRG